MKLLRDLLLAVALVPVAGCGLFSEDIEPIYEIDPDDYVVVHPFADPDFDSPWESDKGHILARKTSEELAAKAPFYVVPYDKVMLLMVAPPDPEGGEGQIGLDVRKLTPAKLAELTGADYVIMGDIDLFRLVDPKAVAWHQATGQLNIRLFKVARSEHEKEEAEELSVRQQRIHAAYRGAGLQEPTATPYGGKFVAQARVTGAFPDTYMGQYGVSFLKPDEAFAGLVRVLSRRTGQLFYEHEPEELAGTRN